MGRRKSVFSDADDDDKRRRNRELQRKYRMKETEEQSERRRRLGRERAAMRRKMETPDQTAQRREMGRLYSISRIQNETPDQRQRRLDMGRMYSATRIQNETPEETARRLELGRMYSSVRRLNETPEEKAMRQESNRLRATVKRMNETPQQKLVRQRAQAGYMAKKRATLKSDPLDSPYSAEWVDEEEDDDSVKVEWNSQIYNFIQTTNHDFLRNFGLTRIIGDDNTEIILPNRDNTRVSAGSMQSETTLHPKHDENVEIPLKRTESSENLALFSSQNPNSTMLDSVQVKQEPPDADSLSLLQQETHMNS